MIKLIMWQVVLDQEKSKVGLGDVYEQEYLKQQQINEGQAKDLDNPKHAEIKKMMERLFVKLDALSNFHYTPKAVSHSGFVYFLVCWEGVGEKKSTDQICYGKKNFSQSKLKTQNQHF